ncbi:MAG: Sulfite reductase flavoprotein alpha-component/vanillate O-demethylase ferredoxin subunit [Lacunisphaera sp.]|nr:Sulfite reductase flavoprotein alpha-component/vanillate O-demethylase ferredoxin subunit [Lacunisphaera sp.]
MAAPGRRVIFQLHLWAALTVGIVLLVVAGTGSFLVFRPELDPVFNRDLFSVTPAGAPRPLDDLVAAARRAHPGAKVDYVLLARDPARSAQVSFLDKRVVFLHPATAAVLGQRGRYEGFFGRCEQWHRFLLLGNVGKFLARAGAMLTIFVLLTGFYLWLPAVLRVLRTGLVLDFKLKGRAWHFNLHKVVGFYAGGVVLVSALTGLPQSFDWMEHGVYKGWGAAPAGPELHSKPPAAGARAAPLQSWLEQAQRLAPDADARTIYFPRQPEAPVEIFSTDRAAFHENARSYLFLDAYSAMVLREVPYEASTPGVKFYLAAMSLHFGQFGGWAGRIILLAGTLAVPILAVTGVAMFLRRRRRLPA